MTKTQVEYVLEIQRDGSWLTYARATSMEQLGQRCRVKDNNRPKAEPRLAALPTRTLRVTTTRLVEVADGNGQWGAL